MLRFKRKLAIIVCASTLCITGFAATKASANGGSVLASVDWVMSKINPMQKKVDDLEAKVKDLESQVEQLKQELDQQ
jgi:peptidoglycan hydrolase CwlO-like protein